MTARPRARYHRPSVRPSLATALAALAPTLLACIVAACTSQVFAPGGSGPLATGRQPEPTDGLHRQAHDALERWADAVAESGGAGITFVGDLTSTIGEWAASVTDGEAALAAGRIAAEPPLSADVPGRSSVRWLDGTSVDVNVLSAREALAHLVAEREGAECPGCVSLRITEARLATSLVETSLGPAEAPTWVFTLEGSDVRVTRVAVDRSVTVRVPPWNADNPPEGISIVHAIGEPDSRRITVQFVGAERGREEPCGADYTVEAVESALAVVIIVTGEVNQPDDVECTALSPHSAEVRLEQRLGEREVLEVRQGLPVQVSAPQ